MPITTLISVESAADAVDQVAAAAAFVRVSRDAVVAVADGTQVPVDQAVAAAEAFVLARQVAAAADGTRVVRRVHHATQVVHTQHLAQAIGHACTKITTATNSKVRTGI